MKKKSKGRVKKFEQENNILTFPDDAAREYEDLREEQNAAYDRYDTQELYHTPLYGNEGYDDQGYDDPDFDPDADFTRNESYKPSASKADFDIDALMQEGWENISRQAAAASASSGWDADSDSDGGEKPHFTAADAYGEQAQAGPGEKSDPMVHRPRTQNKTQDERKKKRVSAKRRRRRLIYMAVITAVLLLVFFTAKNIVELKMEEHELLQEQRDLEARKVELEEELTQVDETDYIEQQAREQLHMIKPGEILYLLPERDQEKDKDQE